MGNPVNHAATFDPLDERVAGAVIGDGQPKGVLRLDDFHLLRAALFVCKDEIVQADLSAQQVAHVDLVRVQRAEQNLKKGVGKIEFGIKIVYNAFFLQLFIN